ncbi:MAG: PEGA domain-containing protein [Melioribacteraceae bacterium]|nr:PEGA domain-containing protein [Melioribacteraceae bacterium]
MNLGYKKFVAVLAIIFLVIIGCEDKEVFTGVEEEDEDFPHGKITIVTTPPGAQVFLNEKNMGVSTPTELPFLLSGEYNIKLRKDLYPDTTFKVVVFDNQISELKFNYNIGRFLGTITVNSEPEKASIFLNDSATGLVTPNIFRNKIPGNYKIKLTSMGHRDDSVSVTVRGGNDTFISIILDDTTRVVTYNYNNSNIGSNSINSVEIDNQGYVWFGTSTIGPVRFNGKVFEKMGLQYNELLGKNISDIKVDNSGTVWCSTYEKLYKYQGGAWTTINLGARVSFNSFEIDNNGVVWGATAGNGICRIEGNEVKFFNSYNVSLAVFPSNNIFDLSINKTTGKIWFTMMGGFGVNTYDGQNWGRITISDMGLNPSIGDFSSKINVDNNGMVWVSYSGVPNLGIIGGLVNYNGSKWSPVNIIGITTNNIKRISNSGDINFISSAFGAAKFKGNLENLSVFNRYNTKLPADVVNDMAIDKSGNLWFVTFNGALKIKKGNFN